MDNSTTKRCSKCGEEFPDTLEYFYKNQHKLRPDCKECCKKEMAIYRDRPENRKRARERERQRRSDNPQKVQDGVLRSRAKKPEKYRAMNLQWRKNNIEKARAISRASRKRNPQAGKVGHHRYQAKKRALPNTLTKEEWLSCLSYFDNCCAVCGKPPGLWHKITLDHWIPLDKGGATSVDNVVPLCWGVEGCNNSKGNREPEKWLIWKFGKHKAKEIIEHIHRYFEWVKEQSDST